jgi:monoamine oxidase
MARSPLFAAVRNTTRTVFASLATGQEAREAVEARLESRRAFLKSAAVLGAGVVAAPAFANPNRSTSLRVGIVGGGMAGMACAYDLRRAGITAIVHEASGRVGGRIFSGGGQWGGTVDFPGQIIERGGELIDTLHKTMIGYAQEFKLPLESYAKAPGEVAYHFFGQRYPEHQVVDQYRAFVPAMRADLRRLSAAPTFFSHTAYDRQLDQMNLREYLVSRGAGALLTEVLVEAYEAEYGLAAEQQSCLNLLYFIRADRRSSFEPFGVSDERYHVVGGNEAIPRAIADRLPGQVRYGETLEAARRNSAGAVELTFRVGNRSQVATYDAVVFAIPFSVLRRVSLHASLGFSPDKLRAINTLGYGTNAKMMVGFRGPYWAAQGCNGASYSDLPNHQATWETNLSKATSDHAVIVDYSSAQRGASLDPRRLQREAEAFVADFDRVVPGARANVKRDGRGNILAHLEHWPSNPLSLGSYTCYTPGQFTSVCGLEAQPQGNCFFAGEHADSFYNWQGFMEGAATSGKTAAANILEAVKVGQL